jgi:hypothetical protein
MQEDRVDLLQLVLVKQAAAAVVLAVQVAVVIQGQAMAVLV